jgi:hypothetical protein
MAVHHESVAELARTFGRIPAEFAAGLREELPRAGEALMRRSQANASWSSRIPGAHYVRPDLSSRSGGVVVGVDQAAAPHARPYEGLSSGGSRGFFRHPVFGDPDIPWEQQDTRPFLAPAVEAEGPALVDAIRDLVRQITSL